mmetsp:Transcript_65699/g.114464  ORF Transcript_65699/g.114464 Transcript_65699/m.114464 type:complete len:333 (+) Transcript_65699:529-1527(+)
MAAREIEEQRVRGVNHGRFRITCGHDDMLRLREVAIMGMKAPGIFSCADPQGAQQRVARTGRQTIGISSEIVSGKIPRMIKHIVMIGRATTGTIRIATRIGKTKIGMTRAPKVGMRSMMIRMRKIGTTLAIGKTGTPKTAIGKTMLPRATIGIRKTKIGGVTTRKRRLGRTPALETLIGKISSGQTILHKRMTGKATARETGTGKAAIGRTITRKTVIGETLLLAAMVGKTNAHKRRIGKTRIGRKRKRKTEIGEKQIGRVQTGRIPRTEMQSKITSAAKIRIHTETGRRAEEVRMRIGTARNGEIGIGKKVNQVPEVGGIKTRRTKMAGLT